MTCARLPGDNGVKLLKLLPLLVDTRKLENLSQFIFHKLVPPSLTFLVNFIIVSLVNFITLTFRREIKHVFVGVILKLRSRHHQVQPFIVYWYPRCISIIQKPFTLKAVNYYIELLCFNLYLNYHFQPIIVFLDIWVWISHRLGCCFSAHDYEFILAKEDIGKLLVNVCDLKLLILFAQNVRKFENIVFAHCGLRYGFCVLFGQRLEPWPSKSFFIAHWTTWGKRERYAIYLT